MIRNGSRVSLRYTLTVDGEVIDSSAERGPLEYVHGLGQIIPGLEEQLTGLEVGDRREITVTPEKGYGPIDPAAVQQVPISAFRDPEGLQVGDTVYGNIEGRRFEARVVEIGPDSATLDLNHPLAGKTLHFAIEIIGVTP